jgi:hypothetical protein
MTKARKLTAPLLLVMAMFLSSIPLVSSQTSCEAGAPNLIQNVVDDRGIAFRVCGLTTQGLDSCA